MTRENDLRICEKTEKTKKTKKTPSATKKL